MTAQDFDIDTVQGDFTVNSTDRIIVKYFAKSSSVTGIAVTLYYEGMTNYSHIHTPVITVGPTGYTGTT
jgi:hypothetical protein